jgi:predicted protein tyrosine phosphatase
MRFLVLSRAQAEGGWIPEVPHILVSINTPGDAYAKIPPNKERVAILRQTFFDLTEPAGIFRSLYTPKHARELVKFVADYAPHAELFVAHCDAGISRSSATCAAVARLLGQDDEWFFTHKRPNTLVYRTILKAGGLL